MDTECVQGTQRELKGQDSLKGPATSHAGEEKVMHMLEKSESSNNDSQQLSSFFQ